MSSYIADLIEELDRQINSLVMDYLVSAGFPRAAYSFAQEADVRPSLESESMQERVEIRSAILGGDMMSAIEKINELNPQVWPQSFPSIRYFVH